MKKKKKSVDFICESCGMEEYIPYQVVRDFDLMDPGDPSEPPRFSCEQCNGEMYPVEYIDVRGKTHTFKGKH
ncbi:MULTISPECIES: hypothetical protein [Piscibacillus]